MMHSSIQAPVERLCPVCGTNAYIHFADERIDPSKISDYTYASRKSPEFMCLRLVRCLGCDLVYAPKPPTSDSLLTAYSEAAFDSDTEAKAAARSYSKALTPYVKNLIGRSAAIDVGAGSGPLLPWLCDCGFTSVIGIEPSRAAIDAAPLNVRAMLREGMFSSSLLTDVEPSLFCSFMTLEHLSEPGEFVRTAYDLLQPGGMLAVVVHNWRAPLNRMLGLRSPIIDVEHLQLFSPKALRALFGRSGLVSIGIQSISNSYSLKYWLRLTPLPTAFKATIYAVLNHFHLSDKQLSLRVGNLLAIGFKP